MKTLGIILIIVIVLSLVVTGILAANAPEGYEDDHGFHENKY